MQSQEFKNNTDQHLIKWMKIKRKYTSNIVQHWPLTRYRWESLISLFFKRRMITSCVPEILWSKFSRKKISPFVALVFLLMCCHAGIPCRWHRTWHSPPPQNTDPVQTCRCAIHWCGSHTGIQNYQFWVRPDRKILPHTHQRTFIFMMLLWW